MNDIIHLNILFGVIKEDIRLIKLQMGANIKIK